MPDATSTEAIIALFGDAAELPEDERRAYVLAADIPDEARRDVLSLLAAHEQVDPRTDRLNLGLAAELLGDGAPPELDSGRRIGAYRILRTLGRGGMGVVYLAERADGAYEQRVALKLLPPALQTDLFARRFVLERQILARLEHAAIARLLDGGVGEHGEPYFVLEYIDGEPLTRWCDERRLGIGDRLLLFLRVCDAVRYAHGRLIVHRDLKPSNILVTRDGEVKLLDFGIAKLLAEGEETEATALTRLGLRPFTPGYAAPEQLRGEAVTVATDVYALGVMLYELLSGRRPHLRHARRRAEDAPRPPTRPSLAVGHKSAGENEEKGESGEPEEVAWARGTSAERLRRRLRGDLDTIALKALREEPEQRYDSVQALAEDVRRHLDGLPVAARPASLRYRAGRFLRRHRAATAAAALVVLAVLGGLAGTTWQARVAGQERDAARLEAAKLAAAQEYLVSLFRAVEPGRSLGEEMTAKELVARGIERVRHELANQPSVQIDMYAVLARVALELGDDEQAARLLAEALPRARRTYGRDHVAIADLLTLRGSLLNDRGDWESAEAVLERALGIYRRLNAEDRGQTLEAREQLGMALTIQGRLEEAAVVLRHAVTAAGRIYGERSIQTASALNNLGVLLSDTWKLDASEDALRRALKIHRALGVEQHPELATAMVYLAMTLTRQGDLVAAEPYYRRGVEMELRLSGPDHPRYAIQLHNLADFLHAAGHYEEAAKLHRKAVAVFEQQFGNQHPYTGAGLDSLASDLVAAGRFDEAMPLFERAGRILRATAGDEHLLYAIHRWRLARALREQGRATDALPPVEEAIAILRSLGPAGEVQLANALNVRAAIRLDHGALAAAETDLRRALAIQRRWLPEHHYAPAHSLAGLAGVLLELGRVEEAEPLAREALGVLSASLPDRHEYRTEAGATLAAIQRSLSAADRVDAE